MKIPSIFFFLSVHASVLPSFLPVLTSITVLTTLYGLSEIRLPTVMGKYWLTLELFIEHLLCAKHCAKADNNCMDYCCFPAETEVWTGKGTCLEVDSCQVMDSEFNPEPLTPKPMFLSAVC